METTTPTRRTRVLIVETDGLQRDMPRAVLSTEPRLEITGATGEAEEAARNAAAVKPDVVLVGLGLEFEQDALALAQSLSAAGSRVMFANVITATELSTEGAGASCPVAIRLVRRGALSSARATSRRSFWSSRADW